MGRVPDAHSRIPSINVPRWKLIDRYEDGDETTIFDYDPGAYPTVYSVYKVILCLQEHSGGLNITRGRVEGDSSANYNFYYTDDGGGTGYATGNTEWALGGMTANTNSLGEFIIRGGNMASDPSSANPVFSGDPAGTQSMHLWGELEVDYPTVSQIRIFSDAEATGTLRVYGLNL